MQEEQRAQTREASACWMDDKSHGVGVMDVGATQPNAFFQKLKR
jgi:hypothetical protein